MKPRIGVRAAARETRTSWCLGSVRAEGAAINKILAF
jgi:hypothetical protein